MTEPERPGGYIHLRQLTRFRDASFVQRTGMSLPARCVSGKTAASGTISVPIDTARLIALSSSSFASCLVQFDATIDCDMAILSTETRASHIRSPRAILTVRASERSATF